MREGEKGSKTNRFFVFVQQLVILGHGNAEQDSRHAFKAVDPLLSLGSLATHVQDQEIEAFAREAHFHDSRRLDSRPEDVLLRRQVVFLSQASQAVKEAVHHQLID